MKPISCRVRGATNPQSKWTQEDRDGIAVLLRRGQTSKQIASRFGRSRSAVIGIVSRDPGLKKIGFERAPGENLGIPRLRKSIAASVGKKTTGRPKAKVQVNNLAYRIARKPKPVIAKPVLVAPVTAGVSLMDIGSHQCRFCINEPEKGTAGHLFCGEVTEPGKSWCAYHETIVWGRGKAGETETVKSARRLAA